MCEFCGCRQCLLMPWLLLELPLRSDLADYTCYPVPYHRYLWLNNAHARRVNQAHKMCSWKWGGRNMQWCVSKPQMSIFVKQSAKKKLEEHHFVKIVSPPSLHNAFYIILRNKLKSLLRREQFIYKIPLSALDSLRSVMRHATNDLRV